MVKMHVLTKESYFHSNNVPQQILQQNLTSCLVATIAGAFVQGSQLEKSVQHAVQGYPL